MFIFYCIIFFVSFYYVRTDFVFCSELKNVNASEHDFQQLFITISGGNVEM